MAYDSSVSGRLTAVRAAIDNVLTAQDYSISGRRTRYAELTQLRALEKELVQESNQPSSMATVAVLVRPS